VSIKLLGEHVVM